MTDAAAEVPEEPAKRSKLPLIIGVVLALAGGGGGYFAVAKGLLPFGGSHESEAGAHGEPGHAAAAEGHGDAPTATPEVAFVPLDPLVISLTQGGNSKFLRFRAQIEAEKAHAGEVEALLPRVTDVMNSYLRALEVADFADPDALTRLRAQMLRRIQVVTGPGRVRDLLIMEFVLS